MDSEVVGSAEISALIVHSCSHAVAAWPRWDLCGLIPPVLTPWSIPPGEFTPWPPQHRSKPTAAMPRRAPGRKPRGERPAQGATPSTHGMTARTILPVLPQEDPKELE